MKQEEHWQDSAEFSLALSGRTLSQADNARVGAGWIVERCVKQA